MRPLSESDTLLVHAPSDGIKGLAMMAPVVGLPFLLHALGGAVITGVGFVAVSTVVSPFAGKILQAAKGLIADPSSGRGKAHQEFPVPVPISGTGSLPVSV
jgi:hypothetical protein